MDPAVALRYENLILDKLAAREAKLEEQEEAREVIIPDPEIVYNQGDDASLE